MTSFEDLDAVVSDAAADRAETRGYRSYGAMAKLWKVGLSCQYGARITEPGRYLLHSEPGGKPHCDAVILSDDGNQVEYFTSAVKHVIPRSVFETGVATCIDKLLLVTYKVVAPDAQTDGPLLNMCAGASDAEVVSPADSDDDGNPSKADDEELVVRVGDELLQKLRMEVARTTKESLTVEDVGLLRCPLCRFRCLSRWAHWYHHIAEHHGPRHQHCCSGTKQLRLVVSLYDQDAASGISGDDYLKRSSLLIRSMVHPPLESSRNEIDRYIRVVFTQEGPVYRNLSSVQGCGGLRRVGNLYYDRGFANVLFRELLLHDSKVVWFKP